MKKIYFFFIVAVLTGLIARSQCSTILPLTLNTSNTITLNGSGSWDITACGFTTPGNEQVFSFTAPVSGTYVLSVTNATTTGYIDYFYKNASGGCSNSGWTCIDDINGTVTVNFGPLTAGEQYYILTDGEGTISREQTFSIGALSTLTTTSTLSPFTACQGSVSAEQSFVIEGGTLTSTVGITVPAGFEISTSPGSGYVSAMTLTPTAGTLLPTTIYTRLTGTNAGNFTGDIMCSASGAPTQNITVSGIVNPVPDVNPVASQTVCSNSSIAAINFTGTVPGTNYVWTNSNPAIGLAASGNGNISSFISSNTTSSPISGTITVTPEFGSIAPELLYYKFDGAGTTVPNLASTAPIGAATATLNGTLAQGGAGTCGGMLESNGVSVNNYLNTNWTPNLNSSWTISFIVSGFSGATTGIEYDVFGSSNGSKPVYCKYTAPQAGGNGLGTFTLYSNGGAPSVEGDFTTVKTVTFVYNHSSQLLLTYLDGVAQNAVVSNFTIDAPLFYVGNVFGGTAGSPTTGSSIDEFRMYNRVLSSTEILGLVNSCTVTGGCLGAPTTFDITVLPSPVMDPVPGQSVCTGNSTTDINFTSNLPGTVYNWTNSDPSIGLAASGTGDILSFTATNTGSTTVTATITVTPVLPGAPACSGSPETFTISVSPVPTGTATPAAQTVCSESAINTISFTGNVPGITFNWTRDNTAAVTGIASSGSGDITGTMINTTNVPVTVTFTVTPDLGGCTGTPFTVTVTINEQLPVATATPASQTICSGNISDILLSSTISGTTFNWTRDNTASVTGIPASGTGDITGTLFNTTTTPVTVTFTITPSFNGCDGAPVTATVLVNAVPTINCVASVGTSNNPGVCGAIVNYPTTVTGAPAPAITHTFTGATNSSGSGNGSGSFFNVGVTTVTVTATNICGAATCTFTVTVNDTENPTITCPAAITQNTDAGLCAATVNTANAVATDNCSVNTLTWTLTGATTGASSSTGINQVGTRSFNKGVTTVTYIAKDAAGNAATCSYTVTVTDAQAPVITCSPNLTVTTPVGSCTAIVNYTITATDNCPGVTTQLVSGPASGAVFPIGTTTVTWKATDAAGNTSASCSFTVTVLDGQLPVISSQPANRTVCAGSNAIFNVTANNVVSYQWQQWNGNAWVNINGANSSSFTVTNTTVSMNTNTFRVVLNGLCTIINSNAATLYVNPLPTISLSASPYTSILPGQSTTLTATVIPTGGSFAWSFNNNPVPGTTGAVISPITVDEGIGTYRVVYTDPNGCVVTSPDHVITGMPSENMWVYPNPSNGFFRVSYYNQTNEEATVMVFNAGGQLVYQRGLTTRLAYSAMVVDLTQTPHGSGIYIVKVVSKTGKELAAKRIVIYR